MVYCSASVLDNSEDDKTKVAAHMNSENLLIHFHIAYERLQVIELEASSTAVCKISLDYCTLNLAT
jgi:hypothetical protein